MDENLRKFEVNDLVAIDLRVVYVTPDTDTDILGRTCTAFAFSLFFFRSHEAKRPPRRVPEPARERHGKALNAVGLKIEAARARVSHSPPNS
ncbi:hypothetical protein EVAR_36393_1 [Eumeta japonica]|uniref:Uncharacterized protein n=1 Tax=Eumeta variegata TaxID=151549 RepID=A0A4C1W676_EUMVA|nr:hypothetical protein EVAR_36393_1 [Eumeta japonica]